MSLLLLFNQPLTTITGTGDLSAQSSAISGTGEVEHTGTGALSAQASQVSGTGLIEGQVTGTGDLQTQASQISGTGEVEHTGTGDLQAQVSQISGTGAIVGVISGTGDLQAQISKIAGIGNKITTVTGTGDLQAQSSQISGTQIVEEDQVTGGWATEEWDWARSPDYQKLRKELKEKEAELEDNPESEEIKEEIEEILEDIDQLPVDNQLALYLDFNKPVETKEISEPVIEKEFLEKKEVKEDYLESINKTLSQQNEILLQQVNVMSEALKALQNTKEDKKEIAEKQEEKEIIELLIQMANL